MLVLADEELVFLGMQEDEVPVHVLHFATPTHQRTVNHLRGSYHGKIKKIKIIIILIRNLICQAPRRATEAPPFSH